MPVPYTIEEDLIGGKMQKVFYSTTLERDFHTIYGKVYEVIYVPKEFLGEEIFGIAYIGTNIAHVRQDLPLFARRAVAYHELYHLIDEYTWGKELGSELRANVVAFVCHPIGFIIAVAMTVLSRKRRAFYATRFRKEN